MNKVLLTIIAVFVYLASTGISYMLFAKGTVAQTSDTTTTTAVPTKTDNDYDALTFDQNAPKTEECPLNGVLYSKQQKNWWKQHRPLGVMIENHQEARPQSGISFA